MTVPMGPPTLAVMRDFAEEGWPSMDLAAEMLLAHVPAAGLRAEHVAPPFRRPLRRLAGLVGAGRVHNAHRLLNRHWTYPRHARALRGRYDLFHVVDHSYAQLVHALPADRTGVYCHDLDAFRCLLDPAAEPRPRWFRAMARRVLAGLQKAAVVFHSTLSVRRALERRGLVDPARLVHAPYGTAPEFRPEPSAADPAPPGPFVLHVGSCAARKRVDVLLDVFAAACARRPELQLVQVGGEWTPAQRGQIERLRIAPAVEQRRGISRTDLAGLYRRAALVLQPSEAEGFGLPVVEALACGAAVVASDIPTLREAGGPAAVFCPVADVPTWADAVCRVLTDPGSAPPWAARLAQAARYSWHEHARVIGEAYLRLRGQETGDRRQ